MGMGDPWSTSAILFPGQGVGDASTRELVEEVRPDLLRRVDELLGDDPFARIGEGTRFAQPAVYCGAIAGFELLGRPSAAFFAGHSLGEVGALVAAGAMDDEAGLEVVVARGELMAEAARDASPGGMLAVGADREAAERLASAHGLVLANENSPRQFVLSGPEDAIAAAEREAKETGVRAKRLAVAGAFHTEAMRAAVAPFRAALERIDFRTAFAPVVSSATGRVLSGDFRDALAAALTLPVRWIDVMRKLREVGITRYVDVGPGKVLAGLVKRTLDDVEVETASEAGSAVA
jgi:[acyl-carrier-protein] S-malonyltransferase